MIEPLKMEIEKKLTGKDTAVMENRELYAYLSGYILALIQEAMPDLRVSQVDGGFVFERADFVS